MINNLSIKNFRGVQNGKIEGLFPLTLLLGPNNSGKSSFLEALSLVTSSGTQLGDVLERVLEQRRWLGLAGVQFVFPQDETRFDGSAEGKTFFLSLKKMQAPEVDLIEAFRSQITTSSIIQINAEGVCSCRTLIDENGNTFTQHNKIPTEPEPSSRIGRCVQSKGLLSCGA